MKKWTLILILGALLTGASSLFAEEVFRIEIGKKDGFEGMKDRDLYRRIYLLELAVDQLQRKVFELERGGGNNSSSWTTCYIKTAFDGTFSSTNPTETAARAGALEKCSNAGVSSVFCNEKDVKCGK